MDVVRGGSGDNWGFVRGVRQCECMDTEGRNTYSGVRGGDGMVGRHVPRGGAAAAAAATETSDAVRTEDRISVQLSALRRPRHLLKTKLKIKTVYIAFL